jgi:hypothetical protein
VPANLGGAMRDMNAQLQAIKVDATGDELDATVKAIGTMARDVLIAKLNVPPKVAALSGDAKTKELEAYRAMLNKLARKLLDLEDAVVAKKTDDAKKLLDEVKQFQKDGHSEFR